MKTNALNLNAQAQAHAARGCGMGDSFIPFSISRVGENRYRLFDGRAEQTITLDLADPKAETAMIQATWDTVAAAQTERGKAAAVGQVKQCLSYLRAGPDHAGPTDDELAKEYRIAYPDSPPPSRAVLVRLSDVKRRPVEWLWLNRIAVGKVTMFAGDPGLGKSFLMLDIIMRVTTALPWPDCPTIPNPAGGAVLLTAEDELDDTVCPRLDELGADTERITALAAVRVPVGEDGQAERAFSLDRDLPHLETAIHATPGCRLVVIDPISAYLGETDSHKSAEVRALLAPLSNLAARLRVAVVCVNHLNKGSGPAMYRTMGSLAFVAAARAAWAVTRDSADPSGDRRLVLPVKNNLGPDNTGLAYRLVQGLIEWESEPVTMTADEALAPPVHDAPGPEPEALGEAEDWLRDVLAAGPMLAKDVKKQAGECAIYDRTLNRAKRTLDVETYRVKVPGPWWWRLPSSKVANDPRLPSSTLPLGNLGYLGNLPTISRGLEGGESKVAKIDGKGECAA